MSERIGGVVVVLGDNGGTQTEVFADEHQAAKFAYPFVRRHWDDAWGPLPHNAVKAVESFLDSGPPTNVIFVFENRNII